MKGWIDGWMDGLTRDFSEQAGCLPRESQEEGWVQRESQASALEEPARNVIIYRPLWGLQWNRAHLCLVSPEAQPGLTGK